ncbi:MAG: leucine-rich repeat protein, partial [Bacteroidales bacterium]|nr:leucine-rich repeat protein [Bacteroidales bacterium]
MKHKVSLLAILLMALALPQSVRAAYDFSAVAPSGQTLYYNITSATEVEVTYPGSEEWRPYYGFTNPTGDLAIPASVSYSGTTYTVTSIGYAAFQYCSGLTSVTIPNSVTSIGSSAFYGCSGLTSVTIPNSVISIGEYAFSGCSGLTSVTIPNSVTSIGNSAFAACSGLVRTFYTGTVAEWCNIDFANYDANPTACSHNLYINNAKITSLVIPEGVVEIKPCAFSGCSALTSVTIPNSVTSIGDDAFAICSGLTSVTIGNSVTSIGSGAFFHCSGLTSVTIPNSVTSIDIGAFNSCSGLTSVTIGNSVTSIGSGAFSGCGLLTSIYFNARNCRDCTPIASFREVVFGDSVEVIPPALMTSTLHSLTIGKSITSIDDNILAYCTGLQRIILRDAPPVTTALAFENVPTNAQIEVPCGMLALYQAAPGWSNFSNITETGVPQLTLQSGVGGTATVVTGATCENLDAVIRADAESGYRFLQWSDGNTDNPRTVNMNQARTLTAQFTEDFVTVSAAANSATGGTVIGAGRYAKGDTVVLTAIPQKGYIFDGWGNGVEDNPYMLVVMSDTTLTALFNTSDTVYVHDTTTVRDTMIAYLVHIADTALVTRYIYDSTTVNNTYYDTFYVFTHAVDTMRILDTVIVNHFQYDTVIRNVYQ